MVIREAQPADIPQIAELLEQLGHPADEDALQARLAALQAEGKSVILVAEAEGVLEGALTLHWYPLLHRATPTARITVLVVRETARRKGTGRALVARAGEIVREQGCGILEVTSNFKRADAHAFYRALGFDTPSLYFRCDPRQESHG